ncbi:hypothetical protein [Pseudomonas syringae]|uniref:hypothetical protein n=1 Tax=Pseudomonas syringae TaxID=317 RepID=UPI0023F8483F|nr:hypothetical protein [Pseudomonas syringae]
MIHQVHAPELQQRNTIECALNTVPALKDMQVALMKSRYTAASAQIEEVTKPKDPAQDRQSIRYKHHEDISPASRPYRRQMPVQLHQSALWAAYIREHLDGLPSLFIKPFAALPIGETAA